MDQILTIFDYLPTSTWTFFTLNVDKKKHFLTTYPPHLVQVVFERTLIVFAYTVGSYIIENIFHQIDHCAVPTRPPRLMSHPSVGQPSMKPFWYMISHIRLQEPAGPMTIQRRERCPKSRRGIEKNQTQMEAAPMMSTR